MPAEAIEATSPAKTGDAPVTGSGNLTMGQAAARLFASEQKAQQQQPAQPAAEQIPPEQSETTETTPAAEAETASPEASPEGTAPAAAEETPAAAETIPEEDADTVHSQTSFTPEQQAILNKRIGKEVKKTAAIKEQYERKIAEMEARLNERATSPATETPAAPPAPIAAGDQPLANIHDFTALGTLQKQAKDAIRYVEEVLDRNADGEPLPQGWDKKSLKEAARNARITLEDHIPMRAQFITQRQQFSQQAAQEFPYLTDKSAPEYQSVQAAYRSHPWLNSLPNADMIVAFQIEGMKAIEAKRAAAKAASTTPAKPLIKPAATVRPGGDQTAAPSGASPATRVPVETATRQKLAAEKAKILAKGGVTAEEGVALLQRNEQLRKLR